jgi:DNA-directed RNA polymerase specialized sigma24 family protein
MSRSSIDPDRFIQALDHLPQLLRIVYLLHAKDGFDYARIAFRIGEDMTAVKQHLASALSTLARALEGDP